MKQVLALTCLLFSCLFVQSQTTFNSSCIASGSMVNTYRNDAYLLAIKRLNDINSPWKDSVIIPEIYIDSISSALYAIQNMDYSPVRDTIAALFESPVSFSHFSPEDSLHIHDPGDWNYSYKLKSIRITVLNTEWGNAPITDLINRYNLTVTPNSFQLYPDATIYVLSSPVAINTIALKNQFAALTGVVYSENNYTAGDGNSITLNIVNGEVFLSYKLGCGDCPLGCTYGRIWDFKVDISTDCTVHYLSAHDWGIITVIPGIFPLCTPLILPIELTSIKVTQQKNFQLIEWKMAMEDNVSSYTIERSVDAANYNSIGEIIVSHPSSAAVNYSWKDAEPIDGKIYYRIKIIDRAGAKKYSPVAYINVKSESAISVFSTFVTNNSINIRFNKVQPGNYTADLLNISGQKLFSTVINVNSSSLLSPLKIPALSAGMYVLLVHGKEMQVKQVIYVQ